MEYEIVCENCKKGKLRVLKRTGGVTVKKGCRGGKVFQSYNDDTMFVDDKCPECGAVKGQRKRRTHQERLDAWKKQGLPMVIVND